MALGYVSDATKVDAKKFAKYVAGQNCANCALYQAKASDPVGGCPLFAGRQVSAKAWCSAWVKRRDGARARSSVNRAAGLLPSK